MTPKTRSKICFALTFALAGCKQENLLQIDHDGDGYSEFDGDCDDVRADIYPGAVEICDDLDNDCDEKIDEEDPSLIWDAVPGWYKDLDGDGYGDPSSWVLACFQREGLTSDDQDCDDTDPNIRPGQTEICDDIDNDCDGEIDGDDSEVDLTTERDWYLDSDQDGYGWAEDYLRQCSKPDGYEDNPNDCDDSSRNINPSGIEICDEIDNDCDMLVDYVDPDVVDATFWYVDADNDTFGDDTTEFLECDGLPIHVNLGGDCDDTDPYVFPAATEYCNGYDDDCDGQTDEDNAVDATTWSADLDGDGFGDASNQRTTCEQPEVFIEDSTDCDDNDPDTYPYAPEYCNGYDDDCDSLVDESDPDAIDLTWYADLDSDGYGDINTYTLSCGQPNNYVSDSTDCDDTDATKFPGATWYKDDDGDGFGDSASTRTSCQTPTNYVADNTDCDDTDSEKRPGVSWYIDIDGDTFGDSAATATDCEGTYPTDVLDNSDCDDSDATIYPNAEETRADGIDQDCDGGDVIWDKVVLDGTVACALDSDGAIYCWGNNSDIIGNEPSDEGYIDIGVGDDHACAIAADGYVDCWGDDSNNQCYSPNLRFSSISLHDDYSCGIRTSGQIYCWGYDSNYDVVDYAPSGTFATLQTSKYYACGQYINGAINCWGSPSASYSELVSDVPSGSFDTISIGTRAACALNSNGVTSCWGNETNIIDNVPSSSFGPYYELSVGETNACVTDSLGAAYCWGATSSIANEPTSSLSGIDMGGYNGTSTTDVACGITGNGEIVCWGSTSYLGTGP